MPSGDGEEGYSFMLLAHGLEAAARVGNHDAYDLLNAWAAWYRATVEDRTGMNPREALIGQNYFAATALMIDYFSPGGKPEDVHTAYYHVYPEWMRELRERNLDGIWHSQRPPALGLLLRLVGLLGHVSRHRRPASTGGGVGRMGNVSRPLATPGGTLAICESDVYPPDSLYVTAAAHTGEMCSMAWWAKLNYRLHQLFPADDRYIAEVEKVIYNVGLADQIGQGDLLSHAPRRQKESPGRIAHTCCEVVGTYLYSTLPEYIYSIADEGLYVNLYEPSAIHWTHAGTPMELVQESSFPFDPNVKLRMKARASHGHEVACARARMGDRGNGRPAERRRRGRREARFICRDRTELVGRRRCQLQLPIAFRSIPYKGADQVPGKNVTP